MNAHELYKRGSLAEAIEAQVKAVKAQPGDQGQRLFLFELLSFAGDLDRAQRQIDAIHYDDPKVETATQGYRILLGAERLRRGTFDQLTPPEFFIPPPEHVNLRLKALQELKSGRPAEAAAMLQSADEQTPPVRGTCNGKAFETLRDADDRFGPVLEVMARDKYYWVPFEQVSTLAMNPPRSARDLLWIPARLGMTDGATGDVFLPALYPGSHAAEENDVKLGRKTEWSADAPVIGLGMKTFLVGDDGMAILEWRQLELA